MEPFAARIHVLLARNAPLGVVIRRGPSKQVCTILWDRRRDRFQVGQWLKGRIYERRSDLSPDGKYLIYFANNGRWFSEARGSYTAISRAPYLKGLALFPKGDCWHGGGLFTSHFTYWLNDGYGHGMLRDTTEVCRDTAFEPYGCYGAECLSVYYPRLLRDGWTFVRQDNAGRWPRYHVFEKGAPAGWVLRKTAHAQGSAPPGRGFYWDEHELVRPGSDVRIAGPDWEWADVDGEQLVWSAGGKLFAGRLRPNGLRGEAELYDFNGMAFQAIAAPY